jgi:hypothetical protein
MKQRAVRRLSKWGQRGVCVASDATSGWSRGVCDEGLNALAALQASAARGMAPGSSSRRVLRRKRGRDAGKAAVHTGATGAQVASGRCATQPERAQPCGDLGAAQPHRMAERAGRFGYRCCARLFAARAA